MRHVQIISIPPLNEHNMGAREREKVTDSRSFYFPWEEMTPKKKKEKVTHTTITHNLNTWKYM